MDSDYELLDAWAAGDKAAANRLFRKHFKPVFRFFCNKINEGVEDLVQQTFLGCVEARDRFERNASFRTFLFATARRTLFAEYRRRRRHDNRIDFTNSSVMDLAPSPSSVVAHKKEQRLLLEALRSIPIDYQIALELYMWEGLKGHELADILGLTEPGARSRLHRAKQALRQRLEDLARSNTQLESTITDFDEWAASLRDLVSAGAD